MNVLTFSEDPVLFGTSILPATNHRLQFAVAARHRDDPRALLLLTPGWVRTDMGGPTARLGVQNSIPNLVKVIEAQRGKSGLQYLDYLGRAVAW